MLLAAKIYETTSVIYLKLQSKTSVLRQTSD